MVIDKRIPTEADLIGSWSCKTVYKDLNVGIVDHIELKQDKTIFDESFIFDNSINLLTKEPVKNYFHLHMST